MTRLLAAAAIVTALAVAYGWTAVTIRNALDANPNQF